MTSPAEQILFDLITNLEGKPNQNLKQMIKLLRVRNGGFSDVEAILHMMDAIVVEATEGKGW